MSTLPIAADLEQFSNNVSATNPYFPFDALIFGRGVLPRCSSVGETDERFVHDVANIALRVGKACHALPRRPNQGERKFGIGAQLRVHTPHQFFVVQNGLLLILQPYRFETWTQRS